METLELIEASLTGRNVVASVEIAALLKLAQMAPLYTRAMTDMMQRAGFGRVDPPLSQRRIPDPDNAQSTFETRYAGTNYRPSRNWSVPGLPGMVSVYVRDSLPDALRTQCEGYILVKQVEAAKRGKRSSDTTVHVAAVRLWIIERRSIFPDGRIVRWENTPPEKRGRKGKHSAQRAEAAFIRSRERPIAAPAYYVPPVPGIDTEGS